MNTHDAVNRYIESVGVPIHALGLFSNKVSLSDITRTVLQAVKDLLQIVAPEEAGRREVVLAGIAKIFDRLSASLPLAWRPFTPIAKYVLVGWFAPLVYDWIVEDEVPSEPAEPSDPKNPTIIHVGPDGRPTARLEALQAKVGDLTNNIDAYLRKEGE